MSQTRKGWRLATLLGVLALVAASCGDGDEVSLAEYQAAVRASHIHLGLVVAEANAETSSPEEALSQAMGQYTVLEFLIDGIGGIDPPDVVRSKHDAWVETALEVQSQVRAILEVADPGSFQRSDINFDTVPAAGDEMEACSALQREYDVYNQVLDVGRRLQVECLSMAFP